jgi:hypothetical protein
VEVHLPDSFFPTGFLNNTERQKMAAGEARFYAVQRSTELTTWFLVSTSHAPCVSGQDTVEPTKAAETARIDTHRNNLAAEQKIMQPIVRTVRDFSFVHCYLACGHMITTMAKDDLKGSPPSIECWACQETIKQGLPSK